MNRVKAKVEYDWNHTASLMAAIANGQLKKKNKKLWTASDFHPSKKSKQKTAVPLSGEQKREGFRALRNFV